MNEEMKTTVEDAVKSAVQPMVDALETKVEVKSVPSFVKTSLSKDEKNVEFLKSLIATARGDMQAANTIAKSIDLATDAAGKYLAPQEWATSISTVADQYGVARKLAGKFPMKYLTANLPKGNAGATGYWVDSAAEITASSPTFTSVQLVAKKLAALVHIDNQMFNNVDINVVNYVIERIGRAFAYQEDNEYLNGDGSTPAITGLLSDATIGEVVMASGDDAFTDISSDYLIAIKSAVPSELRNNAKWIMSDAVFAIVQKLKTTDGIPLYQTLGSSEQGMILGYPVVISSLMPSSTAVDTSFVLFGDFAQGTVMGLNVDVSVDVSTDLMFNFDMSSIRAIEALDMKVLQPTCIAKLTTHA